MLERAINGMLVWIGFFGILEARAQAPQIQQNPPSNAALKYWQAFAALPTFSSAQEKIIDEWYKAPIDREAKKLIESSKNSLLFLHRGTRRAYCNWDLDHDDGPQLQFSHLRKALILGKLTALRARAGFERGDKDSAVKDAMALFVLSRHIGSDGYLMSLLTESGLEEMGIRVLAPQLPNLGDAQLKQVTSRFKGLPPEGSLSVAIRKEKEMTVAWLLRRLKGPNKGTTGGNDLPEHLGSKESIGSLIKWFEKLDGPRRERSLKALAELASCYDELSKSVALPRNEFETQFSKILEKIKSNPFNKLFLPNPKSIVEQDNRRLARLALFKTAIGVAEK
jgi:hypothetical protein